MKNKNIPTHKVCSECKKDKSLEEFGKDKSRKDGKKVYCKSCVKRHYQDHKEERVKYARQHREEHKEDIAEYNQQYSQDHKEEKVERDRKYYQDHKEEKVEYARQYREEHKEEAVEYRKDHKEEFAEYYQEHKEEFAEHNRQHRQTPAGREADRRKHANRKRDLGYTPLNERPDQSGNWRGHHITTEYIIYIPTEMHVTNNHHLRGTYAGRGMDEINELAFEYLFDNTDGLVVPVEFVVELRDSLLN